MCVVVAARARHKSAPDRLVNLADDGELQMISPAPPPPSLRREYIVPRLTAVLGSSYSRQLQSLKKLIENIGSRNNPHSLSSPFPSRRRHRSESVERVPQVPEDWRAGIAVRTQRLRPPSQPPVFDSQDVARFCSRRLSASSDCQQNVASNAEAASSPTPPHSLTETRTSTASTVPMRRHKETNQRQQQQQRKLTGFTSDQIGSCSSNPTSKLWNVLLLLGRVVRQRARPHHLPMDLKSTGRHYWLQPLLLVTTLLCITSVANAKICKDTSIYITGRNPSFGDDWEGLVNCTIIEGSLKITSLDESGLDSPLMANLSFPQLREITDFLLLYQTSQIKSLSPLFPNLSVIRGNRLVKDFALIIYQSGRLEEVGLTSLTHILRGGVRIEKNHRLCYVNTIDWKRILDERYHENIHVEENEYDNKCPNICPDWCKKAGHHQATGLCWNQDKCQIIQDKCPEGTAKEKTCYWFGEANGQLTTCSKECLGGCYDETQKSCYSCRNVFWMPETRGNDCRNKCPPPYLLYRKWRCISTNECMRKTYPVNDDINVPVSYKNYKGECLKECPPATEEKLDGELGPTCQVCKSCPKECQAGMISSLEELQKYAGCTKLIGALTIQLSGENIVQALDEYLHRVVTITGSLKISRSFNIISLDFFRSLSEIQGIYTSDANGKPAYALEILENENLQKLFPVLADGRSVKIRSQNGRDGYSNPGRAFIHYNAKLCKSEIKRLLNSSQMAQPNKADISFATNGDKAVCSSNKLGLTAKVDGGWMVLEFDNYQETIQDNNQDYRALLKYEIHYREISKTMFDARNDEAAKLTKYKGRDACGGDEWKILDHPPSEPNTDGKKLWWSPETTFFYIKPYTYYAIFVATMIMKDIEADVEGAESDIVYVLTPEWEPSVPRDLKVKKLNHTSINVTWSPPESPNGIIDHYEVYLKIQVENVERILLRPFCEAGFGVREDKRVVRPEIEHENHPSVAAGGNSSSSGQCDCNDIGQKRRKQVTISMIEKQEEDKFLDAIIDETFRVKKPLFDTSLSADGKRRRRKRSTNSSSSSTINSFSEIDKIFKQQMKERKSEKDPTNRFYVKYFAKVLADRHHLVVADLKHFASYNLRITACHRSTDAVAKRCSKTVLSQIRTLPKPRGDDIRGKIRFVNRLTNVNETGSVQVSWDPPPDPNMLIVNYNIRIQHVDSDEKQTNHYWCITAKDFKENRNMFRLSQNPGSYYVSVQAVSLSGRGEWTARKFVSILDNKTSSTTIAVAVLIAVLVVAVVASGLIYYFKCLNQQDHMIPSSEYQKTVDVYTVDEWETDRERVEVLDRIGSGQYGVVYDGKFNRPELGIIVCAVKTLKPRIVDDPYHCQNFLNEAQKMKKFNSTHVVKLLGVVSHGSPPLVLMEKMANGSLKDYLEKAKKKKKDQRLTEKDFLQMAAEIADGMAYLSTIKDSNKIVHCDLAARNCLVAEPRVIKISDFGMAHELYQEYYQRGNAGMLPVRWMAPESLAFGKFSIASDVWSFGVVLWEMVTFGETPFGGMNNDVVMLYVKNHGILSRPNDCPDSIFELMRVCWGRVPEQRPTFLDICRKIMQINPNMCDRFIKDAFVTSDHGVAVLEAQKAAAAAAASDDDNDEDVAIAAAMKEVIPMTEIDRREDCVESDQLISSSGSSNGGRLFRQTSNGAPSDLISMVDRNAAAAAAASNNHTSNDESGPTPVTWIRKGWRRVRKFVVDGTGNHPRHNTAKA